MLENPFKGGSMGSTNSWGSKMQDEDLKIKFQEKYNKMISDLDSGKVPSSTYLDAEKWEMTGIQMSELQGSKASNALWNGKYRLRQARKKAQVMEKRQRILSDMIGRDIRNNADMLAVEKALDRREQQLLINKLFSPEEQPEPAPETKESKDFDKELDEKIKLKVDEKIDELDSEVDTDTRDSVEGLH